MTAIELVEWHFGPWIVAALIVALFLKGRIIYWQRQQIKALHERVDMVHRLHGSENVWAAYDEVDWR